MTPPCVVVTGAGGFIGRHCVQELTRRGTTVIPVLRDTADADLRAALERADAVVHLAGVNRPPDPADFLNVNEGSTRRICSVLAQRGTAVPLLLASSTQAGNGTPYGDSKRAAESVVESYAAAGGRGVAFRFPNVFGKWARPRYNSVVATFAHAIARGDTYEIHDPSRAVTLLHVGDAIAAIIDALSLPPATGEFQVRADFPSQTMTLGDLAATLDSFRAQRSSLLLPDFSDRFTRLLYSTYLSHLETLDFSYDLTERVDQRGALAEFVKSPGAGQVFVSRTKPGVTRGNHWHESKVEKFLVVAGDAVIRFRAIDGTSVLEYAVSGDHYRVVDIPPGYVHSIENVGHGDLVTLFWASEIFDPTVPDTYPSQVIP